MLPAADHVRRSPHRHPDPDVPLHRHRGLYTALGARAGPTSAALDGQRALLAEDWSAFGPDFADLWGIALIQGPKVDDKILRHLRAKGRDAWAEPWATGPAEAA